LFSVARLEVVRGIGRGDQVAVLLAITNAFERLSVGTLDLFALGVVCLAVVVEPARGNTHPFNTQKAVRAIAEIAVVTLFLFPWSVTSYGEVAVFVRQSTDLLTFAAAVARGRAIKPAGNSAVSRGRVGVRRRVGRRGIVGRIDFVVRSVDC
jgi:hypothetical protein